MKYEPTTKLPETQWRPLSNTPIPLAQWVDSSHEADQIIITAFRDAQDGKIAQRSLFTIINTRLKVAHIEYVKAFNFDHASPSDLNRVRNCPPSSS